MGRPICTLHAFRDRAVLTWPVGVDDKRIDALAGMDLESPKKDMKGTLG